MAEAELDIKVDTKDAEKAFRDFAKSADSMADKVSKSFDFLKGAAVAAFGIIAGKAVIGAIGSFVDEAANAEKAAQGVASALARMGELSADNLKEIDDFANSLSELKGIEDDTAKQAFGLAASFGITKDQAKKVVDAAADLSAATGTDFIGNVEKLGRSFDGTAGSLREVLPGVRDLSEASLKAGGAVDAIAKAFSGAAAAQLQTFSGAINQTKNAFGNLEESLGNIIVQNPVVIELIKKVGEAFTKLTGFVDGNADGIREFVNKAIILAIEGFGKLLPALKAPIEILDGLRKVITLAAFGVLEFVKVFTKFDFVVSSIKAVAHGYLSIEKSILSVLQLAAKLPSVFGIDATGLEEALQGAQITIDEIDTSLEKLDINSALDGAQESLVAFAEKGDEAFGAVTDAIDETTGATKKLAKSLKELPATTPTPGAGLKNQPKPGKPSDETVSGFSGAIGVKDILGFDPKEVGATLFAAFTQSGEAGAKAFVSTIGGTIGTAFGGPVIGKAVGDLLNLLGNDPETFKKLIDGFIAGIPQIIDNIVKNIPTLVIAIAEHSGEIITALANAMPRVAIALANAMPQVAASLLTQLAQGLTYQISTFFTAIGKAGGDFADAVKGAGDFFKEDIPAAFNDFVGEFIPEAVAKFGDGIEKFFATFGNSLTELFTNVGVDFYNAIIDAGNAFADAVTPTGTSGGIGQKAVDVATKILGPLLPGHAEGKIVPPGYSNDRYMARLSSGEMVIPRDDVSRLHDFLTTEHKARRIERDPDQNISVNVQLNQDTLAKAILTVSRRSQRLFA